jgi:hypothetical protein
MPHLHYGQSDHLIEYLPHGLENKTLFSFLGGSLPRTNEMPSFYNDLRLDQKI